jgi:hypothetical protein
MNKVENLFGCCLKRYLKNSLHLMCQGYMYTVTENFKSTWMIDILFVYSYATH